MRPNRLVPKAAILFILLGSNMAFCLSGEDVARLKDGGVSDRTIELMAREKVLETCAVTVAEILALKTAGVADETIHVLIQEGSFTKDSQPIVYGEDIETIRFTTARDIIELKNAGVSDEAIEAIISAGTADVEAGGDKTALDMLRSMEIIVDTRQRMD
ncbi:MAG: hypothetical protein SWQ30_01210 [Thermodesulfobacteriota bacterium]|nr:hypothetical protein [Thermodesulfobacteriota bacterium]